MDGNSVIVEPFAQSEGHNPVVNNQNAAENMSGQMLPVVQHSIDGFVFGKNRFVLLVFFYFRLIQPLPLKFFYIRYQFRRNAFVDVVVILFELVGEFSFIAKTVTVERNKLGNAVNIFEMIPFLFQTNGIFKKTGQNAGQHSRNPRKRKAPRKMPAQNLFPIGALPAANRRIIYGTAVFIMAQPA